MMVGCIDIENIIVDNIMKQLQKIVFWFPVSSGEDMQVLNDKVKIVEIVGVNIQKRGWGVQIQRVDNVNIIVKQEEQQRVQKIYILEGKVVIVEMVGVYRYRIIKNVSIIMVQV